MPRYTNLDGTTPDKGLGEVLKWQIVDRIAGRRPRSGPFDPPRRDNDGSALAAPRPHLTWVGHATFLQRLAGQLVATDPIWSERIHSAVARLAPPGVALEACPPIDIVTVSHSHYDHLDIPTLRRIGKDALYIVPKDNAEVLRRAGLERIVELGWWETYTSGELRITLVPAQHWSMRVPWDRNQRLWGGFVYASPEVTTYHSGDTAFNERVFTEIRARFPVIDWAMLPIGAYDPRWFMRAQHMNPEEAVQAWELLGAQHFTAMHWATFKLTDEPLAEPAERLSRCWKERGHAPDRLWIPAMGETRAILG